MKKMFKKIKSIFKSKKGDFAIYALIVIPVLITIFTTVITSNYKKTIIETKYQTELDNLALVASKHYTTAYETLNSEHYAVVYNNIFSNDESIYEYRDMPIQNELPLKEISSEEIVERGVLKPNAKASSGDYFTNLCISFLQSLDGVNDYWRLDVQVIKIKGSDSETLKLQLFYALPNITKINATSQYGQAIGSNVTGWYARNRYTWDDATSEIRTLSGGIDDKTKVYTPPKSNKLICNKIVAYSTRQ